MAPLGAPRQHVQHEGWSFSQSCLSSDPADRHHSTRAPSLSVAPAAGDPGHEVVAQGAFELRALAQPAARCAMSSRGPPPHQGVWQFAGAAHPSHKAAGQGRRLRFEPRYQVVVACFLATLTMYVERVGFSIAYTSMAKAAEVDEALKGTVLSAFYWGYAVSQVRRWEGRIVPGCAHLYARVWVDDREAFGAWLAPVRRAQHAGRLPPLGLLCATGAAACPQLARPPSPSLALIRGARQAPNPNPPAGPWWLGGAALWRRPHAVLLLLLLVSGLAAHPRLGQQQPSHHPGAHRGGHLAGLPHPLGAHRHAVGQFCCSDRALGGASFQTKSGRKSGSAKSESLQHCIAVWLVQRLRTGTL